MKKEVYIQKIMAKRALKIKKARRDFWEFCKLMSPVLPPSANPKYTKREKLYQEENREYLKELARALQNIYERKLLKDDGEPYRNIMISMPPRHGKSYTVQLFELWVFGQDPSHRIATVSYSTNFAEDFSEFLRDKIQEKREESDLVSFVYSDIFPEVRLKQSAKAKKKWSLEGYHSSYMGVGFDAGVTGKGYTLMVFDDPHKDSEEALNDELLDKKYRKYTGTFKNRLEGDGMRIIIQTRWSSNDIIGRISNAEEGKHYYKIVQKACKNEDKALKGLEEPQMLCDYILTFDEYKERKADDDPLIFMANNQQELIDKKGALYTNLKQYTELPDNFEQIVAFIDPADEGQDYLAGIVAGKYNGYLYILDILYTQEGSEKTEDVLVDMLIKYDVSICKIEKNGAGNIYARNIKNKLWNTHRRRKPLIQVFHNSKKKIVRILANAVQVQNNILFPPDVHIKHAEAWNHLNQFSRLGKNKHDDIEDALTGLYEHFGEGNTNRLSSVSKKSLGI